jgi:anti-sigma factor RsiW
MGIDRAMSTADCERLRPYLLDFVVGELDPGEAERLSLESHLAGCIECRAAVEELRGTGRALEAVKAFDSQLTAEVRKDITRRAKQEAEKLRAAHSSEDSAGRSRPVPAYAWVVLLLGTVAVLAGVALAPRLFRFGPERGARLLGASGAEFRGEFEPGAAISVPSGALLHLELADGSRLALRGPADAELAGKASPLRLKRGEVVLAAGPAPVQVTLAPFTRLEVQALAQVVLNARPAEDEPALAAVLGGTITFIAPGGDGQSAELGQGQTVGLKQASGLPSVRTSTAPETAPWRRDLPGKAAGGPPPGR